MGSPNENTWEVIYQSNQWETLYRNRFYKYCSAASADLYICLHSINLQLKYLQTGGLSSNFYVNLIQFHGILSDARNKRIIIAAALGGTGERRLLNDLMAYYQKLERPVANESEAVQLKFGLTLMQIMDVVSNRRTSDFFSLETFERDCILQKGRLKLRYCFQLIFDVATTCQDEKNQILMTNIWLNLVSR